MRSRLVVPTVFPLGGVACFAPCRQGLWATSRGEGHPAGPKACKDWRVESKAGLTEAQPSPRFRRSLACLSLTQNSVPDEHVVRVPGGLFASLDLLTTTIAGEAHVGLLCRSSEPSLDKAKFAKPVRVMHRAFYPRPVRSGCSVGPEHTEGVTAPRPAGGSDRLEGFERNGRLRRP